MITRFEQFSSSISCIYRYIQKIERQEMAQYGLKGPHAQCLLAMSRHPEGITATRLCEACDKDKAAISRTLAELEQAQMILRPENDKSRYRAMLKLSPKGQQVASHVQELVALAVEQAGNGLTEENRAVFYGALDLIAGNLRQISLDGIRE